MTTDIFCFIVLTCRFQLLHAHKIAPSWPYPVYDIAHNYLLQGQLDKAVEYLERTDKLAPKGFFACKASLDTLRKEKSGRLPRGAYLSLLEAQSISNLDQVGTLASLIAVLHLALML